MGLCKASTGHTASRSSAAMATRTRKERRFLPRPEGWGLRATDAMSEQQPAVPVIIVGAGAAGLATAACLKRVEVPSVILEASDDIATTWRSLYDRLHLHTIKQL